MALMTLASREIEVKSRERERESTMRRTARWYVWTSEREREPNE